MYGQHIQRYLQKIGEVNFAGASAAQMETIDGKLSNLSQSWGDLLRSLNDFLHIESLVTWVLDKIDWVIKKLTKGIKYLEETIRRKAGKSGKG